eukprot:PLAT3568.1.p1 GENE.PLAT3568.1~~PLAT3568.1.p1  ORF type:complete len:2133 (-),score=873.65 PLAT3568.1:48-5498(-)
MRQCELEGSALDSGGATALAAVEDAFPALFQASSARIREGEQRVERASWLPYVQLYPHVEEHSVYERRVLAKLESVDALLHSERGFLADDDAGDAAARLHELARQHNRRFNIRSRFHADGTSRDVGSSIRAAYARERGEDGGAALGDAARDMIKESAARKRMPNVARLRSLYMLRHVACRRLRLQLLGYLNYARFVQRRLVLMQQFVARSRQQAADVVEEAEEGEKKGEEVGEEGEMTDGAAVTETTGTNPALPTLPMRFRRPHDLPPPSLSTAAASDDQLSARLGSYGQLELLAADGKPFLFDAALNDVDDLEDALELLATHYIAQWEAEDEDDDSKRHAAVDRTALWLQLLQCEVQFQQQKKLLVDTMLELYEHAVDDDRRRAVEQAIVNELARRPRMELSANSFVASYHAELACVEQRRRLLRRVIDALLRSGEAAASCGVPILLARSSDFGKIVDSSPAWEGLPKVKLHDESRPIAALALFPAVASALQVVQAVDTVTSELAEALYISSATKVQCLHFSVLLAAIDAMDDLQSHALLAAPPMTLPMAAIQQALEGSDVEQAIQLANVCRMLLDLQREHVRTVCFQAACQRQQQALQPRDINGKPMYLLDEATDLACSEADFPLAVTELLPVLAEGAAARDAAALLALLPAERRKQLHHVLQVQLLATTIARQAAQHNALLVDGIMDYQASNSSCTRAVMATAYGEGTDAEHRMVELLQRAFSAATEGSRSWGKVAEQQRELCESALHALVEAGEAADSARARCTTDTLQQLVKLCKQGDVVLQLVATYRKLRVQAASLGGEGPVFTIGEHPDIAALHDGGRRRAARLALHPVLDNIEEGTQDAWYLPHQRELLPAFDRGDYFEHYSAALRIINALLHVIQLHCMTASLAPLPVGAQLPHMIGRYITGELTRLQREEAYGRGHSRVSKQKALGELFGGRRSLLFSMLMLAMQRSLERLVEPGLEQDFHRVLLTLTSLGGCDSTGSTAALAEALQCLDSLSGDGQRATHAAVQAVEKEIAEVFAPMERTGLSLSVKVLLLRKITKAARLRLEVLRRLSSEDKLQPATYKAALHKYKDVVEWKVLRRVRVAAAHRRNVHLKEMFSKTTAMLTGETSATGADSSSSRPSSPSGGMDADERDGAAMRAKERLRRRRQIRSRIPMEGDYMSKVQLETEVLQEELEVELLQEDILFTAQRRQQLTDEISRRRALPSLVVREPGKHAAARLHDWWQLLMRKGKRSLDEFGDVSISFSGDDLLTLASQLVDDTADDVGGKLAATKSCLQAESAGRAAAEGRVEELLAEVQRLRSSMERTVQQQVADRVFGVLFEVDALYRKQERLQHELAHCEASVESRLRGEYDGRLRDLSLRLAHAESWRAEQQSALQQRLMDTLSELKIEAGRRLVDSSKTPMHVKRTALAMVGEEEVAIDTRHEAAAVKTALMKMKKLYEMREVAQVSALEHIVRELKLSKSMKEDNTALLAEARAQVESLKRELVATQDALNASLSGAEELDEEMAAVRRKNASLVLWKFNTSKLLAHQSEKLAALMKKEEAEEALVAAPLAGKLAAAQAELVRLREEVGSSQLRLTTTETRLNRQLRAARVALQRETSLKEEAIALTDRLREQLRTSAASRQFQPLFNQLSADYRTVVHENSVLRRRFKELGLPTPTVEPPPPPVVDSKPPSLPRSRPSSTASSRARAAATAAAARPRPPSSRSRSRSRPPSRASRPASAASSTPSSRAFAVRRPASPLMSVGATRLRPASSAAMRRPPTAGGDATASPRPASAAAMPSDGSRSSRRPTTAPPSSTRPSSHRRRR